MRVSRCDCMLGAAALAVNSRNSDPPDVMSTSLLLARSQSGGLEGRAGMIGVETIGNHSFRATGITAYLANGGALE